MPRAARPPASDRARRGRRSTQAGQSSLEYLGVVAVVGVVLAVAVAGAAGAGAGGLVNAFGRGLERALCLVGGGDCSATELRACTVRSSQTAGRLGLRLTFVRLGGRMTLLREELSDGTVDLTLVEGADGAPTAAIGAQGGVRLGAGTIGAGAIATAELMVRLGRRRVWHTADPGAADALERALRREVTAGLATRVPVIGAPLGVLARLAGARDADLPAADEVGVSAGLAGAAEAELPGGAGVRAGLAVSLGGSRSRATGRTTFVLGLDAETSAALAPALGSASLSGSGGATATVTLDRAGAPLDLTVAVAGGLRRGVAVDLGPVAVRGASAGGDRVERAAHLDLTRADNLAAFEGLVDVLRHPRGGDPRAALAGLALRLAEDGRQDLARVASRGRGYGAEAELALGGRVGGGAEVTRESAVLRDAWTRPSGGVWEQRVACLGDAARA